MTGGPEVLIVIQARTGSSRLPGKVLSEIAGRPMLRLQLDRLQPLAGLHPIVVATSDRPGDDAVEALASEAGVATVRGSESDVLGRFGLALERFGPSHVVRLTGDCPLTDPAIVADVIRLHLGSGAAYTSNVHPRSFPKGLDVEVVRADALRAAQAEARTDEEREHVTPFVIAHPDRFPTANLSSGSELGHLWWTVDTAEDLEAMRALLRDEPEPTTVGWRTLLSTD